MMKAFRQIRKAQVAIEYLLLLGVVAAVVMVGFRVFLPKARNSSEHYFNETTRAILGPPPMCATTEAYRINYP